MNVAAAGQKRLVVVGATGMVGGYALRCALDHPAVGRVTASAAGSLASRTQSWQRFCIETSRTAPLSRKHSSGQDAASLLPGRVYGGGAGRPSSAR